MGEAAAVRKKDQTLEDHSSKLNMLKVTLKLR